MGTFTVNRGKRYRATIKLGLFERLASNETVAGKFREVGFDDVDVTGSGRQRLATGRWPHEDATAEIPPQVWDIKEIKEIKDIPVIEA